MKRTLFFAVMLCALSAAATTIVPSTALAHIQLVYPPQRYGEQKRGPCGRSVSQRGQTVTVFEPGQTITVAWKETIDHPGHYRVSFDDDGEDGFVDPAGYDDLNSAPSVLVDGIEGASCGESSQVQITLPNIECENCTLQVIQVMTDKSPYGDGNDIYYQCADIALRPGGGAPSEPPAGLGDDIATSCGCQAGSSTGASLMNGWWLLAVAALLGLRRRRRGHSGHSAVG
jgi:MYXO-CTERM domain-containing protein